MAVLAIVELAEWIKRTNLMLRKRQGDIAAVDKAYDAYHRTRSEIDKKKLHDALTVYLKAKGGHWEKVDRNKKSEGLMKFIYEFTADTAMSATNVLTKRIPESRHGVVYLWSNAIVETQWAAILLEGVFSIGGAANTMFGEDGLKMVPKKLEPLGTTAGIVGAVGGIGSGLARSLRTGQENEAPKPPPPNARHGTIKLKDVEAEQTNFQKFKAFLGQAWDVVYTKVKELVLFLRDKIVMTFTGGAATIVGALSKVIEKVVLMIIKEVCKAAMPFVGAGIDIGRGVSQAVVGIKDKVQSYLARRQFVVTPGHPQLIVSSIETQMNWNIAKGLYNACKGGAKVAGTIFTAGASTIIDVIAAGFEFAVRFFQRIAESLLMNQWVTGIRSIIGNRNEWKADPKDGVWRPRICYDDKNFTRLFEVGCNSSVCIPMLTLNSGICGDQMMFMKMFDDTSDRNVISQKSFDAATGYFSKIKIMGREYVQNSGFRFTSPLKDVNGYFWHAVTHHEAKPTKGELVQKFFTG